MKTALMLGCAVAPMLFATTALAETVTAPAADAVVQTAATGATGASAANIAVGAVVQGRVVGPNGEALPGAEVVVQSTGHRAVTNLQGEFVLNGVAPGEQTLNVSYIGLPASSISVSAVDGRRETVEVLLGASASGGGVTSVGEIVVRGAIADGAARALNQQRNADNTMTLISADSIGRYPDPNIAESLQRASGIAVQRDQGEGRYINVRGAPAAFTAVSVDGVTVPSVDSSTRAVDLDTLPSDIVNSLEVSKSLLPYQDADSIAGAVNIVTRSPFDRRRLRFDAHAGASYNDYGGQDQRAGATISNVFGENQTFGALLSVSYSHTNRKPENVETGWTKMETPDGTEVFAVEEHLFKDYDTRRTRQALTGALEWRPTDSFRAWVRGSYSQFEDDEYRNQLLLTYSESRLRNGATDQTATFDRVTVERQFRHRTQENNILTLTAGAEQQFGDITWDYSVAYANSEQTYPNRNELLFRSTLTPTVSYDYRGDHREPVISIFQTGEHLDNSRYGFRENAFRSNTTEQEEYSLQTNLTIPVELGGRPVEWKFGAKFRSRDVDADEERFRDRRASATPTLSFADLVSDERSQNYGYLLGDKFAPGLVKDYFASARATSERRMPNSVVADYQAQEDVLAGYGQARFDIGATNVIVGLRVEQTKFDGSAPGNDPKAPDVYFDQKVSRDDTEFFPNLTLRHSFSDALIGRFALTRAISRPEYSQIVPRVTSTAEGSTVIDVELGNPDLAPTLSNNVDMGLEYYLSSLGVVSANAFYKDLSDYRYILTTRGEFEGNVADLVRPENAPDGHIAGLELNWQQQFDFLPGWASGFGVFANYTWTDAEIKLGRTYEGRDTFALPGQSDNSYNLALFYEKAGFSARLSYNKRSDYLEEINADDGDLDLWVEGREQLDLTASYTLNNGLEFFAEAKNLTNSAGRRYYGASERTYEYEKFGYNVFFGVRFSL